MNSMKTIWLTYFFVISLLGTAATGFCDPSASSTDEVQEEESYKKYISADDALPAVTAKSAIVMEASTGKILYARNIDEKCYPASTTKAMTLLMALEQGDLDSVVEVSDKAADMEGSTVWLEYDEKVRLEDLLYGMMLVSGNDAATAVAEHIGGSTGHFAEMMTTRAHELGATNTNFCNPSGLPDVRHYTTARDMASIVAYGYTLPKFADIVSTQKYTMLREHDPIYREVENENILLWIYEGGNGVKTGYTDDAGRCLVSAAKRNGIQLIAVVFDSVYMWNDSIAMLNYGFDKVSPVKLLEKDDEFSVVPVSGGQKRQVSLCVKEDVIVSDFGNDASEYQVKTELPAYLFADVYAGDVVGRAVILYNGKQIAATDLVASETVERKSLFRTLYRFFEQYMIGA